MQPGSDHSCPRPDRLPCIDHTTIFANVDGYELLSHVFGSNMRGQESSVFLDLVHAHRSIVYSSLVLSSQSYSPGTRLSFLRCVGACCVAFCLFPPDWRTRPNAATLASRWVSGDNFWSYSGFTLRQSFLLVGSWVAKNDPSEGGDSNGRPTSER